MSPQPGDHTEGMTGADVMNRYTAGMNEAMARLFPGFTGMRWTIPPGWVRPVPKRTGHDCEPFAETGRCPHETAWLYRRRHDQ